MKTNRNSITLILSLSLWLGLILGCSSFKKAMNEKRTEREGPPTMISADDLYKAYESNEAEADKLYQGKIVIITGTIGTISTPDEGMGRPAVVLVDAHQKQIVNCFGFATDAKEAISKLKTGQKVTVKGKCMGKVATDIPSLEDSVLQ
jgi:tRNA_anti-like